MMKKWIRRLKQNFKENGIYKIFNLFTSDVLKGFKEYKKIVNEYGSDVAIFSTAWRGTGDYFICGLYLETYLKKYNISNYVFLIPDNGGERKIVELFQIYKSHVIEKDNIHPIRMFDSFLAERELNIRYFHHGYENPNNLSISALDISLMGHNGLNMVDMYLSYGFMIDNDAMKSMPQFTEDDNSINKLFVQNKLERGKTVLLAPYSTGLKEYEIPQTFWVKIVTELKYRGFTLATNCAGMEKCIPGTIALNIPYHQIVPFLEKAGYFIGIRSGLCDIVAGAACKKILLHTFKARWWLDGRSIVYTGLNNMGLCDDAIELVYENEDGLDALLASTLQNL